MIPVNFDVKLTSSQIDDNKKLIQQLSQDAYTMKLCQDHGISLSRIEKSPWTIKRWVDATKPCIDCKGLQYCRQSTKGYVNSLVDDGLLHMEQQACSYQREYLTATKHMENYLINDLSESMSLVSFQNIDYQSNGTKYTNFVHELLEDVLNGTNIYLYGQMGTGKTYLAACAANYFASAGKKVAFVNYPSFCRRMSQTVMNGEYRSELEKLSYAHFVVFDDIGAESVTEWNRDQILFPVLNQRYESKKMTWFTSNEDINSLEKHFQYANKNKEENMKAARIVERITSMCKVETLTGKDRRKSL